METTRARGLVWAIMEDDVEGRDGDVNDIERLRADLSQELQMK